jgi:hypothetical protein
MLADQLVRDPILHYFAHPGCNGIVCTQSFVAALAGESGRHGQSTKGERMTMFRAIAIALVFLAGTLPAAAQQHWLVGKWTGALTNLPSTNRFGSERTMDVKSVSPDGTKAQAVWVTGGGTVQVTLNVSGNEVSFTTPGTGGAHYKMTHNAGALSGSWTPAGGGGGGGTVNFKKQ